MMIFCLQTVLETLFVLTGEQRLCLLIISLDWKKKKKWYLPSDEHSLQENIQLS